MFARGRGTNRLACKAIKILYILDRKVFFWFVCLFVCLFVEWALIYFINLYIFKLNSWVVFNVASSLRSLTTPS